MIDQVIDWCCLHWRDLFPAYGSASRRKWTFCSRISGSWQMAADWQVRGDAVMRMLSLEIGLEYIKKKKKGFK